MSEDIIAHYDNLVAEGNDPVLDPKPLYAYMDKWDGQKFIQELDLTKNDTVLEIGLGTGRIAVKTTPMCKLLYGIDISPKTIDRAKENLSFADNIKFILGDYLQYVFDVKFDIIYSSLTLMHIENKRLFFSKVFNDLKAGGRFVLSIDDNQDEYIDMGKYKVKVFPDDPRKTKAGLLGAGFVVNKIIKTELANIFVCNK